MGAQLRHRRQAVLRLRRRQRRDDPRARPPLRLPRRRRPQRPNRDRPDRRGSQREPPQRRAAALLALAACTIATPAGGSHARCDARTSTCDPDNPANPDHSGRPVTLNALQSTGPWEDIRAATRRSRDVDNAIDAGYVQIFGCVHEPLAGAMGIHFVNSQLAWPRCT
jgi:hypothetical protein